MRKIKCINNTGMPCLELGKIYEGGRHSFHNNRWIITGDNSHVFLNERFVEVKAEIPKNIKVL